jgi:molecular chaperone DnaK (HSP70)
MNSAFRLKETLYLEISQGKIFPLVPSGRSVPATWQQNFTTFTENQRSFDLHLLRGNSEQLSENSTLGKWRIGGIPPAPKGMHRIQVETRVGVDGSVGIRATLDEQSLAVTLLTEPFPKIPLTFRVPTIPLEKTIQQPCPECKRSFVIRYTNWKEEPFALCLDCGHEFELEDSPISGDTVPWEDLPPELIQTLGIETQHNPGGLDEESLRELQEKGFNFTPAEEPDLTINADKVLRQIPKMFFRSQKTEPDLSVDDILRLAGKPLPESERRHCPKCDAVISRDATRCEWCGQTL